mgnify:CR=1 FL=1
MVICIQCVLEAMNQGRAYAGETDATIGEHLKRVHPNGVDTAERRELERQVAKKLGGERP